MTFAAKLDAAHHSPAWQLVLDKFPWNPDNHDAPSLVRLDDRGHEQSVKAFHLAQVVLRYNQSRQDLQQAMESRRQLAARLAIQHDARFRRVSLVNSSRLLLHLGRSSILENVGLCCERITGLPVIPGTAVKGVVSTWACWEANQGQDAFTPARSSFSSKASAILGANPANDDGASDQAGLVTFLGGFPSRLPALELDIVTPHPDEGRGRITPSPFLAIRDGARWDFLLIASRRCPVEEAQQCLDQASAWLIECLTQLGLGAKTASGYGQFRNLTDDERNNDDGEFDNLKNELNALIVLENAPPEERAFLDYVRGVQDWALAARDVLSKPDEERAFILRFFRSQEGQAIIKGWPKNDKAKQRLANLNKAGL